MHGDKGHVTRLCRRAAVSYEYMLCYVQVGRGPTVIGQPSRLMCVRLSLQRGWSRLPSLSPASAPKAGVWDTSRPCVTHIHTNTLRIPCCQHAFFWSSGPQHTHVHAHQASCIPVYLEVCADGEYVQETRHTTRVQYAICGLELCDVPGTLEHLRPCNT